MCYYPFFLSLFLAGSDLPDDDYTTLVPQSKPINVNNRKISNIIESKENDSISTKTQVSNKNNSNERKTTITNTTKQRSTINKRVLEQTRSAPSSPALSHIDKQRSSHTKISMDQIDDDIKSASSEYYSLSTNTPSNSLSSGTLEVRLKFDAKNSKMWVFVLKATLEMTQRLSKQTLVQVHLTVLPNKRIRFRTRVKPIDNAMFAEEFFCKVSPDTMQNEGIRFRLYTYERFKRVKLLAEAIVMFAMVNLDEDMCKIVQLERAYPSEDSDLSCRVNSQQDSTSRVPEESSNSLLPEIEIGLAYDKNQSMLILEIGKGINFGITSTGRAPDTYVQITLCNSTGEEIITNKTVTRHAQHHPVFAERYPFNIQENYLDQITLVITIINKKSLNKTDQNLGCILFGYNSNRNTEISHWNSMLNSHGETITQWHCLSEK